MDPRFVLAVIQVTWSTIYFTVQTTLCVAFVILGRSERASLREHKAALKAALGRGFRRANRIQHLAASGRPVDPSDAEAVRAYVDWTAWYWASPRRRLSAWLGALLILWPVVVFTPIDVFLGNWGRAIVELCFGLAAGGIALFVVRWNRKLRRTAEVNGWGREPV